MPKNLPMDSQPFVLHLLWKCNAKNMIKALKSLHTSLHWCNSCVYDWFPLFCDLSCVLLCNKKFLIFTVKSRFIWCNNLMIKWIFHITGGKNPPKKTINDYSFTQLTKIQILCTIILRSRKKVPKMSTNPNFFQPESGNKHFFLGHDRW